MKKVLVLMLVLGIASLANATTLLTWSADSVLMNVGGSVTVQLVASDNQPYDPMWVGVDASLVAEITSITKLAAASDGVVVDETGSYPGWWTVEAFTNGSVNLVLAGDQFDVAISGLALGTYVIGSDAYGTSDLLTINVVPEPATMALLGLGGLLLRRRKK